MMKTCLLIQRYDLFLPLQRQFPDADEILSDPDESLLHFVNHMFGPVDEMFVDLLHRLLEVPRQFYLFPEFGGEVGSFHGLHVQVDYAVFLLHLKRGEILIDSLID